MTIKRGQENVRDVLALFNPDSGQGSKLVEAFRALNTSWDAQEGINVYYQESRSIEDGLAKTQRAIESGVDTVVVIGGDGMVNTIGAELIGTDVKLAVLPAGSGNGFARHFDIPGRLDKAAKSLLTGRTMKIDVGYLNDRPFFVTASLAWDADLASGFDKSPIRGIAPYVFAGIYKYFTYEPQTYTMTIDGKDKEIRKPLLLTIANLTQFGGGAKIAPNARADDGQLSLVIIPHMEPHLLVPKIHRLFDGTINKIPELEAISFKELRVYRQREDPVQMDGELLEMGAEIRIEVKQKALNVIVPVKHDPIGVS
jgi:diacylglycerol kinase (ATP)